MIRVAVVEDEETSVSCIKQFISRYTDENELTCAVSWFTSAESFLFSDVNEYDIILMDIQLPGMDGISAVRQLRETNEWVTVVFVTSLAQYAITGYEVGAFDFMVKPLSYYNFAMKFRRAVNLVGRKRDDVIVVRSKNQTNVLRISDIFYVEIAAHTVTYHTKSGDYIATGTMKKVCESLAAYSFSLCCQSYLVNLRYVTQVDGFDVIVADKKLPVSRPRRKDFMHDLNEFFSGNGKGGGINMYELTELFLYKFVFIAELLIAMHLFSFHREKRSHYLLRLIASVVVCMALGYAYPIASFSAWYSSIMFFVLFFFCAVSLYFVYDIPVKQIFFLSFSAYTTQHFAHELYSLLANIFRLATDGTMGMYGSDVFQFSPTSGETWLVVFVYLEVYLLSYWLLYKLFGKKINREDMKISNFSIAVMSALILVVDIVMNAVAVYIIEGYSRTYSILTCVYNLICCALILYIQVSMCVQKKLESELETVSLLLHQSEEQYRRSDENITLLNLKCHDLKHQIREYAGKREIEEEYICDLENIVNIYDSPVKTGNDALDLILTEKNLSCHKNEITLTCLADCSRLGFISDADLYGLFGNIIDNAMEAVMKIADKDKRNINLIVKNVNYFVFIEVENYYEGKIILDESGLPVTTKKDKDYHGYGLKSIGRIIEKYGGDLKISVGEEIFSLSVLFPVSSAP